jgi:L-rhamnose isomerase
MEERENYDFFSSRSRFVFLFIMLAFMFVLTRFADMERSEWMYQIKRMEPQYLVHVKKFVAAAKAHHLSLDWTTTIYPCFKCENMKAHADNKVKSHLIRFGFVNDYTV